MPEARVGMPMLPLDSSCVTVLSIGVPDWPYTHFSLRVMFMAMYLPIFSHYNDLLEPLTVMLFKFSYSIFYAFLCVPVTFHISNKDISVFVSSMF